MKHFLTFILFSILIISVNKAETFPVGSYIINMGVTPQTVGNGMKPYGLVFEFLKTYQVPIKWIIASGKSKDGIDFTYNSVNYRGGTFIISKNYINSTILSRINYWTGQGVVMDTNTTSLTVTVTKTLTSVPLWTINSTNSSISSSLFTHAGIPSSFYTTNGPSVLGACNDIFMMPHADPTWATYGNLYNWNRNFRGAIWANCHAVSVMEGLVNPLNSAERMNFLSTTGLINYGSHADGTAPYRYFFNRASYNGSPISARADDPVFQMMGTEDAAHTNGSEQVYIPSSGGAWRSSVKIGCYDSTQSNVSSFPNGPAAITLYGRGFNNNSYGYVMYQSGHNISGTSAASVSAMRQFFNFSLIAMADKVPTVTPSVMPTVILANTPYTYSVNASSPVSSTLSYQWSSNCGGTFSHPNAASTSFTSGYVFSDTNCIITCIVTDSCSRYSFVTQPISVFSVLPVHLIQFNGSIINNNSEALLNWETINEENLSHFEILRSENGNQFDNIGRVESKRNYFSNNQYNYSDPHINDLENDVIYYKLKMVDRNAFFNTTEPIELDIKKSRKDILSIYPNPAWNLIHLEFNQLFCSHLKVEIIDTYGRIIYTNTNPQMAGNCLLSLNIETLLKGIYYINVINDKGKIASTSFVKI